MENDAPGETVEDRLLEDDLDEWLASDDQFHPPARIEGDEQHVRQVSLEDSINWTLRRIRRARAEVERIAQHARLHRARIDAWEADRAAGPRRLIEQEQINLEQMTRRLADLDPRRRSFSLPAGRVKMTKPGAARLVVHDEAAALAWLRENYPAAVRQPDPPAPTVDKPALKKAAAAVAMSDEETAGVEPGTVHEYAAIDGEFIPGVHYERDTDDRFGYEC